VPNGDVAGGGVPSLELDVPGIPREATSFGALLETTIDFFSGLFGGGGGGFRVVQTAAERDARIAEFQAQKAREPQPIPGRTGLTFIPGTSIVTGRAPIPTPAEGGPPLVTERFEDLPGPFVAPEPLPILQELGIPFLEQPLPGILPFERRAIPEPDVLEEERSQMAVDVPLLTSSFLPALRQATTPAVTGFLGGLAQDVLSGFFRPTGELGLGQVPIRQPVAQVPGMCPPEKPHTRILRFIKQNTGVSINLSRAKSLIRELGLENAARCLGIGAGEVCSLLIVASPRRRRGISASDVRIVKRTARRFENLKHDLSHIGGRAAPHHRRRHTRHK